jgi:hypothetical protein
MLVNKFYIFVIYQTLLFSFNLKKKFDFAAIAADISRSQRLYNIYP